MSNGYTLEEIEEEWKRHKIITEEDQQKMWKKVLITGEEKYMTKYLHDYIKLCHEQEEKPWMWTIHEWECKHKYWKNTEIHKQKLQDKSRCQWVWITINLPPNEERLTLLQQGISKFLKRKCITQLFEKGWYVYEQRLPREKKEECKDRGEHIHMLFKQHSVTNPASQYIRDLAKDFNCGGNCIEIGEPKKAALFKEQYKAQDKLNYILGWKGTAAKRIKQIEDIKWRKDNNLEEYYELAGTKTSPLVVPEKKIED